MDKISRKAKGTQSSYQTVLNNWEIFSEEKFNQRDIIPDLKLVEEETLWDTLQSWINWNSERDNMPQTIKHWFSLLKKYLYHRGIKLTKEDVSENLDFPLKIEESHYPLSIEEAQSIIAAAPFKKKVMYLCMISSGMRIGEICQIKKKHLDLDKSRIQVNIPASIAKYNRQRITFFSKEVAPLLRRHIKKLGDDDMVFGTHDNPKYAEVNEMQQLKRLLNKIGLYERQENGHGKITSHSFRAYFITKVSRFDNDLAHFLAGHKKGVYLPQYDRLTDAEKLELYLKIEEKLLVDDSAITQAELEKTQNEKSELEKKNRHLEIALKKVDELWADKQRMEHIALDD